MKKTLTFITLMIITLVAMTSNVSAAFPKGTEDWREVLPARLLYSRYNDPVNIEDIPADIYSDALASTPAGYTISNIAVIALSTGQMYFRFEYTNGNYPTDPMASKIYEVNSGHSLFSSDVDKEYRFLGYMVNALENKYVDDFKIITDVNTTAGWAYKEVPNPIPYGAANQTPATTPAPVTQSINVVVNGKAINFTGQQPVVQSNTTLVPIREVFEELGFVVTWDDSTKTVFLVNSKDVVIIPIGQATFTANGQTITPSVPAQVINGSTMLPLRAICESIGSEVNWDETTKTATIAYAK